jgi:hypothetical protein
MNYILIALIYQDPTYKSMTFDDVLGGIINHEMYIALKNTSMSQPQRSKKLLSSLTRRARTRKWWLRAQVKKRKKKKWIAPNVMPKRWLSS